ncbi:MAG TPA: cyclase family protein [Xanthobacteraceae bacterium]|nr:cyclase family protein [Xanthobacteraceae bacterium]
MCVPGCREAVSRALSRRGFFGGAAAAAFAATPAHAQRAFTKVIDLTHTLSPAFPTFLGVPGIEIQRRYRLKKDGANVNWWRVLEHAGTHIDAPFHYAENGAAVEAIPVEQLVVPLAVVDVSAQAARNADYALSRGDLAEWEAEHGRFPDGCCVAMHSGWARHANDPARYTGKDAAGVFHFPGFHPGAAEWLLKERSVVGLAVDTLSLDPGSSKDFRTHTVWLPSGRWGIENLANREQVPPSGATLVVGVPKVKGATGAPARILALV